jgi:hypothetical protein
MPTTRAVLLLFVVSCFPFIIPMDALAMTTTTTSTNPSKQQVVLRPPPICSNVPGTWAYDTMSRRIDSEILARTIRDMEKDLARPEFATIRHNIMEKLRPSLVNSAVLPKLPPPHDPYDTVLRDEYETWQTILQPYQSDTWLTAPWLIAEFYVYRQLMVCLDYFNPMSPGFRYDPFRMAKRDGLRASLDSAETCLSRLVSLPHDQNGLALALSFALWGNQMDLSLWPADKANNINKDDGTTTTTTTIRDDRFAKVLAAASEQLLADDTAAVANYCFDVLKPSTHRGGGGGGNVDIIVDNACLELVTDLALATFLIESGVAQTVTFQLKAHPTFVSDALTTDLLQTVAYYASDAVDATRYPSCQQVAMKWQDYLATGRWKCHEDFFWVQPLAMAWDMPEPLRSDLQQHCDLAIVKGDANYRRLLGDLDWPWTTSFADIVEADFPTPLCALRTLKSELACGLTTTATDRASAIDPHWMTDGKFGVVQFARPLRRND